MKITYSILPVHCIIFLFFNIFKRNQREVSLGISMHAYAANKQVYKKRGIMLVAFKSKQNQIRNCEQKINPFYTTQIRIKKDCKNFRKTYYFTRSCFDVKHHRYRRICKNIASAKLENKEHDHLIYSRFNEFCMSLTEVSMNLKEGDILLQ